MEFVYGTLVMVAAIALLGFARYAVANWEDARIVRDFAAAEVTALLITTMSASGIALLCAGVAANRAALGHAELGAALGVIVLAGVAVIRLTRRRAPVTHPKPAATGPATP